MTQPFSLHSQPASASTQAPTSMIETHDAHALTGSEVRKMHLQIRHASKTELVRWLRAARMYHQNIEDVIDDVLAACPCRTATRPAPFPVSTTTLPSRVTHEDVCVDIIFLEIALSFTWSSSPRDGQKQSYFPRDTLTHAYGLFG